MITDCELHAFVDGQLAGQERSHVLEASSKSPLLSRRLAELQRLKQLVQSAYREPPPQLPRRTLRAVP
jgi:anti-sigma factor RsiW